MHCSIVRTLQSCSSHLSRTMLEKVSSTVLSTVSYCITSTSSLLTILSLTLITWYILWKKTRFRRLIEKVPGINPWPIVGDAPNLDPNPTVVLKLLLKWADERRKDGLYRLMLLEKPWILIYSAENMEILLNSTTNISKSVDYGNMHLWLGLGLLTSTGSKWKSRRRMLTPGFHFSILKDFVALMNNHARELRDKLMREVCDTGEPYNILEDITLNTLDIVCDTAMGVEIGALNGGNSEYIKAMDTIKNGLDERARSPIDEIDTIYFLKPKGRKVKKAIDQAHKFTLQVIKERREAKESGEDYEGNQKRHKPFLDLLLECRDEEGKPLTDSDIREEVDTFMFEGHDTTSSGIGYTIYLLGRNIEVQRKCQKTLENIISDPTQDITMAELSKMHYLECCIKEAMRMFPPVPMIGRELAEDTVFGGHTVPKGAVVIPFVMALGYDPQVFPEPEKYDPNRFIQENCVKRDPFAYVPFSAGPRNCIGQKFAMMEMKIVIATLLLHFNIESTQAKDELGNRTALVLQPVNGIKVKLTTR